MDLHGKQIIGIQSTSAESGETFFGINPRNGNDLPTAFHEATAEEVDAAAQLAQNAFDSFRQTTAEQRALFLEAIADETEAISEPLIERASAETGHPVARCAAEISRSVNQARLFAEFIREGSWVDARIDRADPNRKPAPKPDVRSMMLPMGPIAVFGASNFPIAISVLGADVISALACGCPVVVKGHPAHPGTCEISAEAIIRAAKKCNLPEGVFSLVHGKGHAVGIELVKHPAICAGAFTGSLAGGRALFDVANNRPDPIPFYAELGSVNPIFVLPGALAERADQIAEGFVAALTTGVGQFCTSPGLVFGLGSKGLENFSKAAVEKVSEYIPQTMLHAGIHHAFVSGVDSLKNCNELELTGESAQRPLPEKAEAGCYLFQTDAAGLETNPALYEEIFGPVSTVVECGSPDELEKFAEQLDGSLSASVHGTEEDLKNYARLITILERKTGRLVFNGYPVGLEVCHSMHHGGPFPATCHSHFTSVGTRCINRFVRPVCYQDWPQSALPVELQDTNPAEIWRIVDGEQRNDRVV